jgi:hypothetical protein
MPVSQTLIISLPGEGIVAGGRKRTLRVNLLQIADRSVGIIPYPANKVGHRDKHMDRVAILLDSPSANEQTGRPWRLRLDRRSGCFRFALKSQ